MVELAKGLHKSGHTIIVAALYGGGMLKNDLENAGVPVHVFGKVGRWDVFGFLIKLIKYTRSVRPDVLHGYHVIPNLLAIICKPFLRDIIIIWGVRSSDVDLNKYDWLAKCTFMLSCMSARFADRIIVNSSKGLKYHQSHGYPRERMVVVFNGIDTDKYRHDHQARVRIRAELGIKPEVRLIGMIARIDPMKDFETFLHAVKIIIKDKLDVHFICAGGGSGKYRDSIIRMCNEMGLDDYVSWIGERHDMPEVYNALDVLTSCSITEGFSNVVAEAMSCGVPCVVTDVGDSANIVGETGFVVPVKSPQSLARGWGQCLDRYIEYPNDMARQRIITEFSLNTMLNNTESSIMSIQEELVIC